MSSYFNSTKNFSINVKNVGAEFKDNRYYDRFNGKVKVTSVTEVEKGAKKGCIIIHMTAPELNGKEIQDWFSPRKNATEDEWAQTMVNRLAGALMSSGMVFKEDAKVSVKALTEAVKKKLPGKEVTISQFTRQGRQYPNVNYFFDEKDGEESSDEEEDVDIDNLFVA